MRESTAGSLEEKLWSAYRRKIPVLLHKGVHTKLLIAHNNLTQTQIRRVASRIRDHDDRLRRLLRERCVEGDLKSDLFLGVESASGRFDSTLQRVIVAKPFVVEPPSVYDGETGVEFKKKRRRTTSEDDDGMGLVYFMLETKVIRTRKVRGPRTGPSSGVGTVYCTEDNVPMGVLTGLLKAY